MRAMRKSRLSPYKQGRLIEHFVSGAPLLAFHQALAYPVPQP